MITSRGEPGSIWGDTRTTPAPPGRFGTAGDPIAVGAHGHLLIAAEQFPRRGGAITRIVQLSPSGHTLSRWIPLGHGADRSAVGLTTDEEGGIFLADRRDTGVVELTPGGRLLRRWFMPHYRPPLTDGPPYAPQVDGIAAAPWGSIYATADDSLWAVSDSGWTFRVLVHGSSNVPSRHSLAQVAVEPVGRKIYAIDQERRVDVFSTTGKQLGRRQPREVCAGIVFNPVTIAVGPRGTLYVADGDPIDQILKFSPGGRLLARWGSRGSGPDQFKFFFGGGLAVGPRGNVFVSDISGRLRKFSPAGRLLASWR